MFAENGHRLALVARRERELTALADEIAVAGHARPHVIAIDLGLADAPGRLAEALRACDIEPEFVVNDAGFGLMGAAADLDRGEQLAMIDLNVRTLTDLSLRWIESLARHRGGILNVASVAGFLPGPSMAVYHATKAYVLSFSEALHRELKPQDVRVSVLCPGPVRTEFQARAGIPGDYFPRYLSRSADRVAHEGYEGLMLGRRVVVPGSHNKVLSILARMLPHSLALSLVESRGRKQPSSRRPSPAIIAQT